MRTSSIFHKKHLLSREKQSTHETTTYAQGNKKWRSQSYQIVRRLPGTML